MWSTSNTFRSPPAEPAKMIDGTMAKTISNNIDFDRVDNGTYPTSQTLSFPYPSGPYPQQAALMDTLLEGIPRKARLQQQEQERKKSSSDNPTDVHTPRTRVLALESPTGTGKSLSLACAGLAWLDYEEGRYYSNRKEDTVSEQTPRKVGRDSSEKRPSPTSVVECTGSSTGIDWLDSWKPHNDKATEEQGSSTGIDWLDSWQPENEKVTKEQAARDRHMEHHRKLVEALDNLRQRLYPVSERSTDTNQRSSLQQQHHERLSCEQKQRHREKRENLLRMALTKSKMEERKRVREKNRKRKRDAALGKARAPPLVYEDEEDDGNGNEGGDHSKEDRWKQKIANLTRDSAEWLLLNPHRRGDEASEVSPPRPPQIVYSARTHSQLTQFVQEIHKTKWGKKLRVVALGSRGQGLCGELTKKKNHKSNNNTMEKGCAASEALLTETCLELRSKGGKGCSHYSSDESVSTLALHGMVEATDLEDMVSLGRSTKTCAYYAARAAVPHAQLVVLPYASLCSKSSREALGLQLHSNTLVLIDEAHNLPSAIANLNSATLALGIAEGARSQLDNYIQKYVDRLSPHHLRLLGDLKRLVRGLIASMTAHGNKSRGRLQPQQREHEEEQRCLMSSSQFLVSQRLESINLFPVLRYMKESKLSQKLLGFMNKPGEAAAAMAADDSNSSSNKDEKSWTPSHISPMSIVETFLEKLTYASDDDGQVVIDKGDRFQGVSDPEASMVGVRKEAHLQFCVLNPAVQARDDLWTAPRAVALVGGTLQPLDVMMRELIPGTVAEHAAKAQSSWRRQQQQRTTSYSANTRVGISNPYQTKQAHNRTTTAKAIGGGHGNPKQTKIYRSNDFWAFTCGHVVDPAQVLLQPLTSVGRLPIDVRHKTRSTPLMTNAIGTALVKLCQKVRHGMVVFLPSYKYEAILVNAWKKPPENQHRTNGTGRTIWDQLNHATTVVREPKEASQIEATLSLYSTAASKSPKGALLLSVVGGKLSEGINFADDLCRCVVVVGLPFADRSDPLLREKLKLVAANGSTNGSITSHAASDYYRSLCLRAVNQSVGRAIRHAKDWATIVLMDVRYPTEDAIAKGLPSWLTDSTPSWRKDSGELEDVIHRTEAFFHRRSQE